MHARMWVWQLYSLRPTSVNWNLVRFKVHTPLKLWRYINSIIIMLLSDVCLTSVAYIWRTEKPIGRLKLVQR